MKFISTKKQGFGTGKKIGCPTINMEIPEGFTLEEGIYASRVLLQGEKYIGALHYGPVPTFARDEPQLEVHLLGFVDRVIGDDEPIQVEIVKYLREIKMFHSPEELMEQINKDIEEIYGIMGKW